MNNSDNALPHIPAWVSPLPHLARIWELSSLSHTDISFFFFSFVSICPYLCSVFIFFLFCFFTFSLTSLTFFLFYPVFFLSLLGFFLFVHLWLGSYVSAKHLTFLSSNVHSMLSYKVALGTKGRPKFKTSDSFWSQWSFVDLHYVLRDISQENCRVSAGKTGRIKNRKWSLLVCTFCCGSSKY